MTDQREGAPSQGLEVQIEVGGTTFEISTFRVSGGSKYGSSVCAGFVPVLATEDDFDTPDEAIWAGASLLFAKLFGKQSLQQKIVWGFTFSCQILAVCLFIVVIEVVGAIEKLGRTRR